MPDRDPSGLPPRPILVIGRSGQVAQALVERGEARGLPIAPRGRHDTDITDPDALAAAIDNIRPRVVVNAAAYTAVDRAETEPEAAFAANRDGPAHLAQVCARRKLPLIHISTDYVFDGSKTGPYVETDPTGPTGVYGASKRAGEEAVAAAGGPSIVVRTAWVYSPFGANFVKTMLRLAADRDTLNVVDDQHGNPTSALDLVDALLVIADRADDHALFARAPGEVFHAAGTGTTTWCGLARHVFAASERLGGPHAVVHAIPTSAYPTPAKRPANSALDCRKLADRFGLGLPEWQASVERTVERLLRA